MFKLSVEEHGWARLDIGGPEVCLGLRLSYINDVVVDLCSMSRFILQRVDGEVARWQMEPGKAVITHFALNETSALHVKYRTSEYQVEAPASKMSAALVTMLRTVDRDRYDNSWGSHFPFPADEVANLQILT